MASSLETKTALILGATGAVGKPLLSFLLSQSCFSHVHSFVRASSLSSAPTVSPGKSYSQHPLDFEKLLSGDPTESAKLRDVQADVVYITLGTTRADAGSAEKFERIDRDYVVGAVKAALATTDKPAAGKRVVYCSSQSANSGSPILYSKSKGLTEEALSRLAEDVIIFRPGFLAEAERKKSRLVESIFGRVMGVASHFTNSAQIPVSTLAMGIMKAGELGSVDLSAHSVGTPPSPSFKRDLSLNNSVTIVSNAEALQLGKYDHV